MSTYTIRFYAGDPITLGFPGSGSSFTYAGPADTAFEAVVTDTQGGILGQTLSEGAEETATAVVTRLSDGFTDTSKRIAAVISYTIRDTTTGDLFEVVRLRVYSMGGLSGSSYTLSEQPLVQGRTYEVVATDTTPNAGAGDPVFTYSDYVCLADGTPIDTPGGPRPVETLRPGDAVITLDHGTQAILWTGRRRLSLPPGRHPQNPILLPAGCLGPGRPVADIAVSPQHRVLLPEGAGGEMLGPAKGLLPLPGVRPLNGRREVAYNAFLLAAHGIAFAAGAAVETFWPGPVALGLLSAAERAALETLFPGIRSGPAAYGHPARPFASHARTRSAARAWRDPALARRHAALPKRAAAAKWPLSI